MALDGFIRDHHSEIIDEFETFARTLMPPGSNMTDVELRDHAEEMLLALVDDMRSAQSSHQQLRKSQGLGDVRAMASSGRLHADARIRHGFSPGHLLAEFRALRASVLRLYEETGEADLAGVRRFNEAIDEALTESMARYGAITDQYRDQFVGILGHDLRNPLGAITAGAALLLISADFEPRQKTVASRILRSAQRMGRMIDDLLDLTLARLGGTIPLKKAPTDLEALCQEVILEVQTARSTAIRFESSGDLTGNWDGDRLAQVVSNLLGNAVQHGDGREVDLTVVGAAQEVLLSIHNLGIPIPPETQRSIFEPLARGSGGPDGSSLGLGLFIARAIVTSHGGAIEVSSSADGGTTFTARIPR